jgi:predicted alpha/beta-hydrolase family hydrolase
MAAPSTRTIEVTTPSGPAQVLLQVPTEPSALLLLGHGAGGGVEAADITAARDAALSVGAAVARVVQPYRVLGRRSPAPAPRLDEAWQAVAESLTRRRALTGLALVCGGRSSGARVACRCADALGAVGVVALAFPVHPPGRPQQSRLPELTAVSAPVLVVQGSRDPFGCPPDDVLRPPSRLVVIEGADHGLKRGLPTVRAAVADFLPAVVQRAAIGAS